MDKNLVEERYVIISLKKLKWYAKGLHYVEKSSFNAIVQELQAISIEEMDFVKWTGPLSQRPIYIKTTNSKTNSRHLPGAEIVLVKDMAVLYWKVLESAFKSM